MAKGQQRSNKEARKPKKAKAKTIAANPSQKGGVRGLETLKNSLNGGTSANAIGTFCSVTEPSRRSRIVANCKSTVLPVTPVAATVQTGMCRRDFSSLSRSARLPMVISDPVSMIASS